MLPERGYDTAGTGWIWQYDVPSGTVVRWDGQTYQSVADIPVTESAVYGGLCLTSIAAGAGAVWVTVAVERQLRLLNRRLPRRLPQPTLSLPSVPAATLASDVVVLTRGGEQ